ncbi:MAG TPA: hypothetical protein VEJ67_06640 [Candidatus Cybelea sp.]|nr:hypothetical protein [Candidatus Cybelea sp.]
MAEKAKADKQKSIERALEDAVSRALRDNLAPLQRTAEDLQQAYADLVAACASTRPANALPAMLRAQTAASSLAAGLAVLSNFVTLALNPREHHTSPEEPEARESGAAATETIEQPQTSPATAAVDEESEWAEEPVEPQGSPVEVELSPEASLTGEEEKVTADARTFDLASLPPEVQDLHRRANRVAKVAMQDIQLLRPKDVRLGREHKDICHRLRTDLDKARREYDRRFRAILDDPIDYFHHWMVEILAAGEPEALGEYPYPSPVLRH